MRADPKPRWLEFAEQSLGQRRMPGAEHNPHIVRMFALAGHPYVKDDETPACAAGIGAWLSQCGITPSGSLMAVSYKSFGVHIDEPRYGCIAVVEWPNGAHVGIVTDWDDATITLLGANQGASKGISEVNETRFLRSARWTFRWPVPLKTADDLADEGSRHVALGKGLNGAGWLTTVTAVGAGVTAVNSTTDATTSMLAKMASNPWPFAMIIVGTALGIGLSAAGGLLKAWRVGDANSGRKP